MSDTALVPLSAYLNTQGMQKSIQNTLGDRTPEFIASIISLVNTNPKFQECDRQSLINACLVAAVLNLPINQNLGYAYIVPYQNNKEKRTDAQFQMGWKGFVQLAMRTGLYSRINTREVKEGELIEEDYLSGDIKFKFLEKDREKAKTIGYVAFFKLKSGFEKVNYMTSLEISQHAIKYSQSNRAGFGPWKDNPDAMSRKTVLKLLISKFGPMSNELAKAIKDDQAIIDPNGVQYIDNKADSADDIAKDKELTRIKNCIETAKDITSLEQCKQAVLDWNDADLIDLYTVKAESFGGTE